MSETKHTPLPWRYSEYRPRGGHLRLCIGNKEASGQVLIARDVGLKRENLKFIVQTINARPKMEELVRMIKKSAEVAASKENRQEAAAVVLDLVLPHLADKAREVEAALGKAQ